MVKRRNDLNLTRISILLPQSTLDWIDKEVSAGAAQNRSEYIREIIQTERLRKKFREDVEARVDTKTYSTIGGRLLEDIKRDYMNKDLDDVWVDSLSYEEREKLMTYLESLDEDHTI